MSFSYRQVVCNIKAYAEEREELKRKFEQENAAKSAVEAEKEDKVKEIKELQTQQMIAEVEKYEYHKKCQQNGKKYEMKLKEKKNEIANLNNANEELRKRIAKTDMELNNFFYENNQLKMRQKTLEDQVAQLQAQLGSPLEELSAPTERQLVLL